MKKIYQTPNTIVVNIQTTQIIASSIDVGQEYQENDVVLSRRRSFSIWSDDDNTDE